LFGLVQENAAELLDIEAHLGKLITEVEAEIPKVKEARPTKHRPKPAAKSATASHNSLLKNKGSPESVTA
jgi:hypothetical protein